MTGVNPYQSFYFLGVNQIVYLLLFIHPFVMSSPDNDGYPSYAEALDCLERDRDSAFYLTQPASWHILTEPTDHTVMDRMFHPEPWPIDMDRAREWINMTDEQKEAERLDGEAEEEKVELDHYLKAQQRFDQLFKPIEEITEEQKTQIRREYLELSFESVTDDQAYYTALLRALDLDYD